MKTQDVVIFLLAIIVFILLVKKVQSGYIAGNSITNRQASFVSQVSGVWKDIDPAASPWPAGSLIPGAPILSRVTLEKLNLLMYTGTDTVTNPDGTTQTISLPQGVTPANVWGIRKAFITTADNLPAGDSVWFLITNPVSLNKLTQTIISGPIWDSGDANIGRVMLPSFVILAKSLEDPRDPIDCTYTATMASPSCTATACGTTGFTKYNVTVSTQSSRGGVCQFTNANTATKTPISGSGLLTSLEPCASPACTFASVSQVGAFLGGGSPAPAPSPRAPAPSPRAPAPAPAPYFSPAPAPAPAPAPRAPAPAPRAPAPAPAATSQGGFASESRHRGETCTTDDQCMDTNVQGYRDICTNFVCRSDV